MKRIQVQVVGLTPLLCNRFTDENAEAATSGKSLVMKAPKGTTREQAEKKLYLDSDGKPVIPGPNIFRCIIDAGVFVKVGKKQLTTTKSSLIPAFVALEELEVPIRSKGPWSVDARAVRIPATGGRIMAYRPRFDDWSLRFVLGLDEDMAEQVLREVLDHGSKKIGLGDFRPACKGPFGRFRVDEWRVLKS